MNSIVTDWSPVSYVSINPKEKRRGDEEKRRKKENKKIEGKQTKKLFLPCSAALLAIVVMYAHITPSVGSSFRRSICIDCFVNVSPMERKI